MIDDAERALMLARGLQLAGRTDAAVDAYRRVVALAPHYSTAHRQLADLHLARGERDLAIHDLVRYLDATPLDGAAHSLLIDLLSETDGPKAAAEHYDLVLVGGTAIPDGRVCACVVVRDEADRLPFFLDHHRKLGVAAFIVIDNGSGDGTVELLTARDDVQLWRAPGDYWRAGAGYAWVNVVLRLLEREGWWIFLDADELFTYPPGDSLWLPDLCDTLDAEGAEALSAVLVDCYSQAPLSQAKSAPGEDPRETCGWFDRAWGTTVVVGEAEEVWGGVRQRVFPVDGGYLLSKVPLVRWRPGVAVAPGAHTAAGAGTCSSRRAALLHFKLLSDLGARAARGVRVREESVGSQYRAYSAVSAAAELTIFDPSLSVRYSGPQQLADLGVIV